jgi:hypothetical protein
MHPSKQLHRITALLLAGAAVFITVFVAGPAAHAAGVPPSITFTPHCDDGGVKVDVIATSNDGADHTMVVTRDVSGQGPQVVNDTFVLLAGDPFSKSDHFAVKDLVVQFSVTEDGVTIGLSPMWFVTLTDPCVSEVLPLDGPQGDVPPPDIVPIGDPPADEPPAVEPAAPPDEVPPVFEPPVFEPPALEPPALEPVDPPVDPVEPVAPPVQVPAVEESPTPTTGPLLDAPVAQAGAAPVAVAVLPVVVEPVRAAAPALEPVITTRTLARTGSGPVGLQVMAGALLVLAGLLLVRASDGRGRMVR